VIFTVLSATELTEFCATMCVNTQFELLAVAGARIYSRIERMGLGTNQFSC